MTLKAVNHDINAGEQSLNNRDLPGNSYVKVEISAYRAMRSGLIKAVQKRTIALTSVRVPLLGDLITLTFAMNKSITKNKLVGRT